jgi:glycosyltransferase involved in cell wall biosynthesis
MSENKVTVVISTWNRLEELKRTVRSIQESRYPFVSVLVVVDGNENILEIAKLGVGVISNPTRMDYVASMNRATKLVWGMMLYASDDLLFPKEFIGRAVSKFEEKFPDGKGLLGFDTVSVPKNTKYAFGLMDSAFLDLFPKRQVFCPDYIHYGSDDELGRFAESINRFYFFDEIGIEHARLQDATSVLANEMRSRDEEIRLKRIGRGLLWGRTFERVRSILV